jgi:lipoprotein-anchoring transpeptidase ErfK/SrfK
VSSSLRSPVRASLLAGLLALLAFGPGAQASPGDAAAVRSIRVVGSGDLNWTVTVRAEPRVDAKRVTVLKQFRSDYRPQVVLAIAKLSDPKTGKAAWYRISVPGRPNGRTGWVQARAVTLHPMHWEIVIYRGARRMELWKDGRLNYTTTVAVGRPGMETPLGTFYVTVRFHPVQETFLGVFAFETSAYSKLSEWPGGGKVGIHGTYEPQLLGQAVSHGCVRMSNTAAAYLRDRIPVGTPIRIVP